MSLKLFVASLASSSAAISAAFLPASAWIPALAADGGVREKAELTELTDLLTLAGWPDRMRVIVRR